MYPVYILVCLLHLGITAFFMVRYLRHNKSRNFSRPIAWLKILLTGLFILWAVQMNPGNMLLQILGIMIFAIDAIYISLLYQYTEPTNFKDFHFFANEKFEELWNSSPSYLTVKNIPIRYYINDEWTYKSPDGKYETTIGIAEGNLLIEHAKGEVDAEQTKAGLEFVLQIVRQMGLENVDYYYIADTTKITKASFKARKFVIEFHEKHKNLRQFVLITNSFTRVLIKLMAPINPEVINRWLISDTVENAIFQIFNKNKTEAPAVSMAETTLHEKRIEQMYTMISQISLRKFDEIEPVTISKNDLFYGVFTALEILKNDKKEILQELNTLLDNSYQTMKEQELKILSARYESLKNQINPHFLFNSLNVLTELIYKDQNQAVHFVTELSKIYRYIITYLNHELVDIETELNFIKSFTYLLKIRYGKNLNINIHYEEEEYFLILPLALQLLVENCIKHNIATSEEPLTINISLEASYIVVSNNLQTIKVMPDSSLVGLKSIQERYRHLSDLPVLVINDSKSFIVKLPKLKMELPEVF